MTDSTKGIALDFLKHNCSIVNVIYKASVKTGEDCKNDEKIYIGATEMSWRYGCYNHKLRVNNGKYTNSRKFSKRVLKGKSLTIKWDIVKKEQA